MSSGKDPCSRTAGADQAGSAGLVGNEPTMVRDQVGHKRRVNAYIKLSGLGNEFFAGEERKEPGQS